MKFIRLATIAALSSTILAGGAVSVFAQEAREVETDASVSFTATDEDGEGEKTEVDPPEVTEPPVVIPPIVEPMTGPLTIAYAPTMNFGSQVISNQDQDYAMIAEMQAVADEDGNASDETIPYVSFAQVQDTRGTNEGWDLQVSLSDFTADTQNSVLTGAQISLANPEIRYSGNNQENAPVHTGNLVLLPGTGAQSVMTAEETKGAGTSSVVWGNQAELDAQAADEDTAVVRNQAIQLSIPGSTAKDATTYTSTLTWELTSTPGDDA
ncbi:WxL domain-containing protein [Enterococcus casseliflavus]|nr:WxL domain-containing protein [Enterococcus casseliflavus]